MLAARPDVELPVAELARAGAAGHAQVGVRTIATTDDRTRRRVILSHSEVAEVLGLSETTVEDGWRFARAWLGRELADEG